jgi:hypothetical protein
LVVLFALSVATAICLDGDSVGPADDFVFATFTTDDESMFVASLTPAWVSAIRSDLAGIDPDRRPSVSTRICSP